MQNSEIRPLIGVSADFLASKSGTWHRTRDTYVQAILNAGGAPILIPALADEASLYTIFQNLDGLLLTGGADIDPALYGEEMNGAEDIMPNRDSSELLLANWALDDDLPLLGICRGHQVLNVATGGTLHQDIPQDFPTSPHDHRGSHHAGDRTLPVHQVSVTPGCKLAGVVGSLDFAVNSLHHQSVKRVGDGLQVVARSEDGVVEGLESRLHRWVVSVQWHPEEMWGNHSEAAALFAAFVSAARQEALRRRENELALTR